MKYKNRRNFGFLITEMIVAGSVLGIIVAGLALSLYTFSSLNHYHLTTQHCIAAAQAQLDSVTATGKPIADEDFQRLWPDITIAMEETPGTGQWEGLKLTKVTATAQSYRAKVKVQLSRYVENAPAEKENPENNQPAKEDS